MPFCTMLLLCGTGSDRWTMHPHVRSGNPPPPAEFARRASNRQVGLASRDDVTETVVTSGGLC
jgi:hypothetical protein